MADGPNVQGMVSDPQFQSLAPADKRNALSSLTGDKSFASLSDADTMRFVSSFGTRQSDPLTQQTQAAATGAGIARPGVAPVPQPSTLAQNTPGIPQGQQMLGTPIGPPMAGPLSAGTGGFTAAAGLQGLESGRQQGQSWGRAAYTGAKSAAETYAGGKAIEALAPQLSKILPAAKNVWGKLAGTPKAIEEAENAYQEAHSEYTESVAARDRAKIDLDAKNAALAEKNTPRTPSEQNVQKLNQAINAPAGAKIRIGDSKFDEAFQEPGRGLAKEGFNPESLAKMSPQRQVDAITPKWNASGKAVDAVANVAEDQGKTVNIYKIDEAIDKVPDADERTRAHSAVLTIGKDLDIKDWGNVSPSDALKMRRSLWDMGEKNASRYISGALREAVPELKEIDQHYSDLNAANDAARSGLRRQIAGKKVPVPNLGTPTAKVPAILNRPAPIPPTPIDREAIAAQQSAALRLEIAKGALKVAGAGALGTLGVEAIQRLRGK